MGNITIRISVGAEEFSKDQLLEIIDTSVGEGGVGPQTEITIKNNSIRHEVTTSKSLHSAAKWGHITAEPTPASAYTAKWATNTVSYGQDEVMYYGQDENPFSVDLDDAEDAENEDVAFEDDQDVNAIAGDL